MAYIAQADLITHLSVAELTQLTTDDTTETEPDADVLAAIIADTDAEVDSYIGQSYSVPIETPGDFLKSLCKAIALYRLYMRKQVPPEHVVVARDEALLTLQAVAEGRRRFDDEALLHPYTSRITGTTEISTTEKYYTDDNLGVGETDDPDDYEEF